MTYPNHFAWRTEPPSGLYGAVLHGVMGDVALSAEVGVAVGILKKSLWWRLWRWLWREGSWTLGKQGGCFFCNLVTFRNLWNFAF